MTTDPSPYPVRLDGELDPRLQSLVVAQGTTDLQALRMPEEGLVPPTRGL